MAQVNMGNLEDQIISGSRSALDELLREGARRMLQSAVETEVAEYLAQNSSLRDAEGRCLVVRNGHLPERSLVTGVGPVRLKQPRPLTLQKPSLTYSIFPMIFSW